MMKKLFTLIILGIVSLSVNAEMKVMQEKLRRISHIVDDETADQLLQEGNNNRAYHTEWPGTSGLQQALVIIEWERMPVTDLGGLTPATEKGNPNKVVHRTQGTMESEIYVPLGTKQLTLTHPKYGDAVIYLKDMKNHDVWSVPVIIDNLSNIEIRPLTDYDKSVRVTLVNPATGLEQEKMSPATFENVSSGTYTVRFAIDGSNVERNITVTPSQKVFGGEAFDFRHKKDITIESTEKGKFYVDGAYAGEGEILKVNLPYGPHTVAVVVNEDLKDEKTLDVNKDSDNIIYLSPIKSKTFEVIGTFGGKTVPTKIWVSGLSEGRFNSSEESENHKFTLPVGGTPYTYHVYYDGHEGSRQISVNSNMDPVQKIRIKGDNKIVWPWEREYVPVINWVEISYVSKQYVTGGSLYGDGSSIKTTIKENGVWDDGYNCWLHGFRFGYHYQPALKIGLGLYTGLFGEFYFSSANSTPIDKYDKYFEFDLSLPLHAMYQVPLAREFCIGFHTGPSFNYVAGAKYYYDTENSSNNDDWSDFWDEPWAPSRFNVDWDFGLFIRLKRFMITGTLSRGLTNNKMHEEYSSDAKTVMNKAIVGVSFGF